MHDFVVGAVDETVAMYYQLPALMRGYNFPMGKWASNSNPIKDIWKVGEFDIKPVTQVLGVSWDTTRNTLYMDQNNV
jgi:hypothetical protein